MNRISTKFAVALGTISAVIMGTAVGAFATTTPDPVTETNKLLTAGTDQLGPVLIAVATGVLALAVLAFGLRKAFSAIRSGGRHI